jgi:Fur family transcriptional regulator, peroxide stress response regulator
LLSVETPRQDSLRRLEEICREKGLPVTSQRRTVLEVLLRRSDHPTADQVYEAVQAGLPQISRRTVYRVLDTLVEFDLIRRVHHPGAVARFDGMIHRHHHLVCTRCHKILDLESSALDDMPLPAGKPQGFVIHDFSVQFMGVCPDCRKSKKSSPTQETRHE